MCDDVKSQWGMTNDFKVKGGMKAQGEAFKRNGMVLVFSLWDAGDGIPWLDTGNAGTCPKGSGKAPDVERDHPGATVTFSSVKIGEFGSTYSGGPTPPPPSGKCPGGTWATCMAKCPSNPKSAW